MGREKDEQRVNPKKDNGAGASEGFIRNESEGGGKLLLDSDKNGQGARI